MAGITGFLARSVSEFGGPDLERMVGRMRYGTFQNSGICLGSECGAYAGWISPDQHQPVCAWNAARSVALVLFGEVFRDESPSASAHGLNGAQELEEWISSYERSGIEFLSMLNGWFSGLLLDIRSRTAVLFNDRYGLGRVYYHENASAFFFSSEAKSLLEILPQTRNLDWRGLGEWLSCGCVLQNRTLFRGIELLPPGSAWSFSSDGRISKRRYFVPDNWEALPPLRPAEYRKQLEETFPRILRRYLTSRRNVGMSLTGGLDGRMIMAWAKRMSGALPCYTFNGPYRDCADVKIAREVARACGQPHQTITLDGGFFGAFASLAEQSIRASDGAMDVTGAAEIYLNRLAREIAPVRLTGNYGSEILRGHVAFKPRVLPAGLFSLDCVRAAEAAARTYAEEAAMRRLSFIAFKQVPWHHYARFAVERSELTPRSPYLDNDLVALAYQAPPESSMALEPSLELIAAGDADLGRIPTDRGVTWPANRRVNCLQRTFQEFLAKAEYACDYGMPDWLARANRWVSPLRMDRVFLGRQKFCHFRTWYRRELASCVQEMLLDPNIRTRPYVNGAAVEPMVAAHIRGTRNCTLEIHKLLSLELIHRALLSPGASGPASQ